MNNDQKNWLRINEPVGKSLGYPECCIKQFCLQTPTFMKLKGATYEDQLRFKASHKDGVYTGFIPCTKHAKEILSGKITLDSLITNRDSKFQKFPNEWNTI
jgi:hypothetical protein